MLDTVPIGPYRTIEMDDGHKAPWYVIPFDKQGNCVAPLTRDHLLAAMKDDVYTDIFLFSHGWNTNWPDAVEFYDDFIMGYQGMIRDNGLTYPRPFRPLLIGVFWPSIVLLLPAERSPMFAAFPQSMDQQLRAIEDIAADLDSAKTARFYALVQSKQPLSQEEAFELAQIAAPFYGRVDDELPGNEQPPSATEVVALWRATDPDATQWDLSGNFGYAFDNTPFTIPQAAVSPLDPRWPLWALTTWRMKDRAGTVGALGVNLLLRDLLLVNNATHLHLVGHSYGCKVLLSAICFCELPRRVESLLLLEPALSYLCFARNALGTGLAGGYRDALDRVELPILSTFSAHDRELTTLFHHFVRRPSDFAEQRIAGIPPNRYAALGGYGPGGCEPHCQKIAIKPIGESYNLEAGTVKIYGLNATEAISSHGAISNTYTWWALYSQVACEQRRSNDG